MDNVRAGLQRPAAGLAGPQQTGVSPQNGQSPVQDARAADFGRAARAMRMVAHPDIPALMKNGLWNGVVAPSMGEAMGGGGLPTFDSWPEELNDYAKKADRIMNGAKLQPEEQAAALKALMAEAELDYRLAPGIETFKKDQEFQHNVETMQVMEMMGAGEGSELSDGDVATFMGIRSRNPKAFVDAAEMLDNDRLRRNSEAISPEFPEEGDIGELQDEGIFSDILNPGDDIDPGIYAEPNNEIDTEGLEELFSEIPLDGGA